MLDVVREKDVVMISNMENKVPGVHQVQCKHIDLFAFVVSFPNIRSRINGFN